MKKLLFTFLLLLGLVAPLASRAQAQTEVSLNFFYDNLGDQGYWLDVAGYGYCFQPQVAVDNADWRPYADGYWAYTDVGWTWVSYEDFGWATYHYGRWADLGDYGWVWVPGYEWGPAWVSWRTGGDYVGWAPLPPVRDRGPIYEGGAITGQVDLQFDIGPEYYNFVSLQYIGEPVLRGHIIRPQQNVTIINRTVNVTNITYNNSVVYNYGPNFERVNQYSRRPVERLTIHRETTINNINVQGGGGRRNLNRVNNGQLMVVAPQIQKSQQQIAPKAVKKKVENPVVQRGWQKVANKQQLQAEMRKENPKNIPAPDLKPQKNRKAPNAAVAAGDSNNDQTAQPNQENNAAQQQDANVGDNAQNPQQKQREARREARQEKQQNEKAQQTKEGGEGAAVEGNGSREKRRATREARQDEQSANNNDGNAGAKKAEAANGNQGNASEQKTEKANSTDDRKEQQTARREARRERQNANKGSGNATENNSEAAKAEKATGENTERANADRGSGNARQEQQAKRREGRQEPQQAEPQQTEKRDRPRAERARDQDRGEQPAARPERAQQQPEQAPERRQPARAERQENRAERAQDNARNKGNNPQRKAKKKAAAEDENNKKSDQP